MSEEPATPERRDGPPGLPRWVKISFAVVGILVVLVVGLALAGGQHSPGRHLGGDEPSKTHTAPSGGGHTPPPGAHE